MAAFDKNNGPMPWLLSGPERISVVHPALDDDDMMKHMSTDDD
jgi:hypothetical protein